MHPAALKLKNLTWHHFRSFVPMAAAFSGLHHSRESRSEKNIGGLEFLAVSGLSRI
jgi:hypothetical protein